MSFSINIDNTQLFPVITLKDESTNTEAEIYSFGALLNAFTVSTKNGRKNIIDGFASVSDAKENITEAFKSAKLSPFVCRMANGEYSFDDKRHKIEKFYLGKEAIHGLLFNVPFNIQNFYTDEESVFVKLVYDYNNRNEGYPFPYRTEVVYTLSSGNKLHLKTTVINQGDSEIPISDGWHPYFQLGETINDLRVQFNSNTMLEFDSHLLPTGNTISNTKFETMQLFGDTFLDNCFVLKNNQSAACILKDEKSALQLSIIADSSYPYLQVYTPPHRKSIAVENLSSAPDSFNNHIGLVIAKPGEQYSFAASYTIILL